jgi:hypothetical protein
MAACGGTATPTTTADAQESPATTTTIAPAATTVAATAPAMVLAVLSGRGDDGSFEVAVYFAHAPGDERIVVGIDADDSYRGSGDPSGDLEGWVEFGDLIVVGSEGAVVAGGSGPSVGEWMSWGVEGTTLRLFLIRDVAPVAGTLWVVVGDGSAPGSIAGVVTGEGCSARGSDLPVVVIGDFPDPGVPCRYP